MKFDLSNMGKGHSAIAMAVGLVATVGVCTDAVSAASGEWRQRAEQLGPGETLSIPKGEYHFGREGSRRLWLDPSNNASGFKDVVFPLFDKRGVTIDGNGSTLVFHDCTFPFAATNCHGLTLKNFTIKTATAPFAVFTVKAKSDQGFEIQMDADSAPYKVTNGEFELNFEGLKLSTKTGCLSLHSVDRLRVHFLVTPDTPGDRSQYATTYMSVTAKDLGSGRVRFEYAEPDHPRETILPFKTGDRCMLPYALGEKVAVNLTGHRDQVALFFEDCEGVTLSEVKIPRFGGMGVVAQRSGNLKISSLEVLPEGEGRVTTTADIMHLVNCYGSVVIENSRAGYSMDDVLNIHGNYLEVEAVKATQVTLRAKHPDHSGFFPYRPGDTVEFSEVHSRKIVHTAQVVAVERDAKDAYVCRLTLSQGSSAVRPGQLVENATLCPNVTIRGNHFHHFPNMRLSGRGKYLVEKNRIAHSRTALVALDLAEYWYESGRIFDMRLRDNDFIDCNHFGGDTFMNFGVSGWEGKTGAPKVHRTIRLEHNRFEGVKGKRWQVEGVRSFEVVE